MSKVTSKKYRSWKHIPLALQIVISIVFAVSLGTLLGGQANVPIFRSRPLQSGITVAC